MRALFIDRFGLPEELILRDVTPPVPGAGEVLIEVHAIGVNYPDLLVVAGKYQDLFPLPFVPGKEGAGIVIEIGEAVTNVRIGDRISFEIEAGAYAEQVVVAANHCYPVPPGISLIQAAAMGLAYQTAYFALTDRAQLEPGEWVIVTGAAGGVGIAGVQLAKALGARVIGGVGTASKAEFVLGEGADAVVDLCKPDLDRVLRQEVLQITDGHGADIVLDQVGGVQFGSCLRALTAGGRLIVTGFTSGVIPTVRTNYLLMKHISVVGMNWGRYRDNDPARVATAQARIFGMVQAGKLRPPVMACFPLERAAEALT